MLLLGASVSQLPAIRHARASGLRVVAVDGDSEAVGFGEADVAEVLDFSDVDGVVEVGRRHAVDGVAAICSDRSVPVAAEVAERLGLPGIGVEIARAMTDKATMRTRLAEHGVPQPSFGFASSVDEAVRLLAELGPDVVLKPVDSGGQRGVFRVTRQQELADRVPQALGFSRRGLAIVERYLDGDELNGIAVARDGVVQLLTLSDRLRPHGPGFGVGWIHRFPSNLPAATLERSAAVAVRAVEALGLRDGIAFPQLLVVKGDTYVVEVAARVPAGQMADLVYHGVGVDLIEIALQQSLGKRIADDLVRPSEPRPTVVRFFTAKPGILPTGCVTAVQGLERVRDAPGVLDADLYLQLGETIEPVQVDADRRGYVIATGTDTTAALEAANRAMRLLDVRTG